jgi:hypothetical protein
MNAIAKREEGRLGPCMLALPNDRWRDFVRALVVHPPGYGALVNSYVAAGFGGPDSKRQTLSKHAHQLSRDERIIAAVREEATKLLRLGHPEAVNVLYDIMRDPNHKDRLKAASEFLARSDPLTTQHRIDVTHRTIDPDQEAIEELRAARSLGATRERLCELFGEDGLTRIEALERVDDLRRSQAAKLIDGKAEETE